MWQRDVKSWVCVQVGASNELPESEELDALYDRFLIRRHVAQVHSPFPTRRKQAVTNDDATRLSKHNLNTGDAIHLQTSRWCRSVTDTGSSGSHCIEVACQSVSGQDILRSIRCSLGCKMRTGIVSAAGFPCSAGGRPAGQPLVWGWHALVQRGRGVQWRGHQRGRRHRQIRGPHPRGVQVRCPLPCHVSQCSFCSLPFLDVVDCTARPWSG